MCIHSLLHHLMHNQRRAIIWPANCEMSMFIKDNGIDIFFITVALHSTHSDEKIPVI